MTDERLDQWRRAESELDRSGMGATIRGLADQLVDAVGRARSFAGALRIDRSPPASIVALGMGGSAIGAEMAAAGTRDRRRLPVTVVRDYDIPGWVDERTVVVASSYSGETEETLAGYDAAVRRGARVIAVTTGGTLGERARSAGFPVMELPGGYQPRAAVAYGFASSAMIQAALDPGLDLESEEMEVRLAAERVRPLPDQWLAWQADNPALEIARACADGLAVIHGGHPVARAAAVRWKSQLNENAKLPAFHVDLPEQNHNEIVGLEGDHPARQVLVLVHLETPWDDPRVRRRFDALERYAADRVAAQFRVRAEGKTPIESLWWLCCMGDCASFLASIVTGHDPTPVSSIDRLKTELRN